jgi:aldose 1-epimerase
MAFQVRIEHRLPTGGPSGTFVVLTELTTGTQATISLEAGCNCFQWQVSTPAGLRDLLYYTPELLAGDRPTRYGIPVLFPFPNRLRAGRFTWDGKTYQLPLNDAPPQNAIHGFACRSPWRIVALGTDATNAWATAEFWGTKDAPATRSLWPADYRLRLTYRLEALRLRIEALVENPDKVPLPFGLGFHQYFPVPLGGGGPADTWVEALGGTTWELIDSLPTGERRPVGPANDLRRPRPVGSLNLDELYTDLLPSPQPGTEGLHRRGAVGGPGPFRTDLWTSAAFRELLVFTPPHRQAVCLEPYTCPTDALNLQASGTEAGLLVLPPGGQWSGVVEMRVGLGNGDQ